MTSLQSSIERSSLSHSIAGPNYSDSSESLDDSLEPTKIHAENHRDVMNGDEENQLLKIVTVSSDDYTILTKNERLALALTLSLIGLCSSISMPIYWTALTQLEQDFHTTEARINYTVTAYLCFQAVAPVFISSLTDIWGRRPVFLICITGGIITNVGLAVSRTYWLIVFLRCVLATFLAPLISIVAASVGDFTTKRNRGGLTAITQGFTLIGQGIAPFLGAVMDTAWDWEAIFWFSAAFEGLILLIAFLFIPETHRGYVGDLSVRPKSIIHKSPILYYFKDRLVDYDSEKMEKVKHKYNPWAPLKLIFKIDVFYILLPASLIFTLWTISQTSLSVHLSKDYKLPVLHVGLCFFAPGLASFFGTLAIGKVLDSIYAKQKKKYNIKYLTNNNREDKNAIEDIPPFNIINVRLVSIPVASLITSLASIVFGWCLEYKTNLAPILIMSFTLTMGAMCPLNIAGTVLVDMYPQISGGAIALNNLFRCGMSAIFVSCLDRMESSMTTGGTYTFMAGLSLIFTSLIIILMKKSEQILIRSQTKEMEEQ